MAPQTFAGAIKSLAEKDPNKPAFVFVDKKFNRKVLSRQDLNILSQKFAAILVRYGVKRGDVVCNTLPNSPLKLITQVGTHMAGAVYMNGEICLADGADFIHNLKQGQIKFIVLDSDNRKGARKILESLLPQGSELLGPKCLHIPTLPTLKAIIPSVAEDGTLLMEKIESEEERVFEDLLPSDECCFMCTSGSTGFYKLVAFRNENLLEWGRSFGRSLGVTEASVYLNDRPLGWIAGYPSTYAAVGCTRVLLDFTNGGPEDPIRFTWEIIDREKCTNSYSVPLQLEKLTEEAKRKPHASGHILDAMGCGSGLVLKRHMQAIGVVAKAVPTVYGSTETGIAATWWVTDPDVYEDFVSGAPTPGTEFKIVDAEGDLETPLPPGEQGEILQRTTQASRRYVDDEKATRETFLADGWIRLGDYGFINSKGQLSVMGRNKFAILRGPSIFYPEQLEIRIAQCPGVENAVVTGVPDADQFEEICAMIVRKPHGEQVTEGQVRTFCETELFVPSDNKEMDPLPKYYVFVPTCPTFNNGKLNRREARRIAVDMLGL